MSTDAHNEFHKPPPRSRGATPDDPTRPSFGNFPYEIQLAILEQAAHTQVIFMDFYTVAPRREIIFSDPSAAGLSGTFNLAREVYLKDRQLCKFGDQGYWIHDRDIFYLRTYDDPMVNGGVDGSARQYGTCDLSVIRNIAVDLYRIWGFNSRLCMASQLLGRFPFMKGMYIFVPGGDAVSAPWHATPRTLMLSEIRDPTDEVEDLPGSGRLEEVDIIHAQVKVACWEAWRKWVTIRILPEPAIADVCVFLARVQNSSPADVEEEVGEETSAGSDEEDVGEETIANSEDEEVSGETTVASDDEDAGEETTTTVSDEEAGEETNVADGRTAGNRAVVARYAALSLLYNITFDDSLLAKHNVVNGNNPTQDD